VEGRNAILLKLNLTDTGMRKNLSDFTETVLLGSKVGYYLFTSIINIPTDEWLTKRKVEDGCTI
jgi:hypothetical protein